MLGAPNLDELAFCLDDDCRIRHLCELSKGRAKPAHFRVDESECNAFYPVEDLRGDTGHTEHRGRNKHNRYNGASHVKPVVKPPTYTRNTKVATHRLGWIK